MLEMEVMTNLAEMAFDIQDSNGKTTEFYEFWLKAN